MVETIMLVARPKNRNVMWATAPHRARMISRYVWQCGACCLSLDAIIAKSRTIVLAKVLIVGCLPDLLWIVAPEAYHQGPLSPNL